MPNSELTTEQKFEITRMVHGILSELLVPTANLLIALGTAYETWTRYLSQSEQEHKQEHKDKSILTRVELFSSTIWALASIISIGSNLARTYLTARFQAMTTNWFSAIGAANNTEGQILETVKNNINQCLSTLEEIRSTEPLEPISEDAIQKLENALSQALDILAQSSRGIGVSYYTSILSELIAGAANIANIGFQLKNDSITLIGAKIANLVTTISMFTKSINELFSWKVRKPKNPQEHAEILNDIITLIKGLKENIDRHLEKIKGPTGTQTVLNEPEEKQVKTLDEKLKKLNNALSSVQTAFNSLQTQIESGMQSIEETTPLLEEGQPRGFYGNAQTQPKFTESRRNKFTKGAK